MAWSPSSYSGTHQYRKEASAAGRANETRAVLKDAQEPPHKRKAIPAYKRKFGIERRYIGPARGSLRFLFGDDHEWHINYNGWYEKERDRDNALIALRKNSYRGYYEYHAVNRP